jgi:hypothetical protein
MAAQDAAIGGADEQDEVTVAELVGTQVRVSLDYDRHGARHELAIVRHRPDNELPTEAAFRQLNEVRHREPLTVCARNDPRTLWLHVRIRPPCVARGHVGDSHVHQPGLIRLTGREPNKSSRQIRCHASELRPITPSGSICR